MVKKNLLYRFPYVIYGWMIPIQHTVEYSEYQIYSILEEVEDRGEATHSIAVFYMYI